MDKNENKQQTNKKLLQPYQWSEMEARNPVVAYRSAKDIYCINIEVDEQTWLDFKTNVPKGALLYCQFFYHDGSNEQLLETLKDKTLVPGIEETEPEITQQEPDTTNPIKEKGTYSNYWRGMFIKQFHFSRQLWHVLGLSQADINAKNAQNVIKMRFYKIFDVTSMSHVSPDSFEMWCDQHELLMLITLSRQARVNTDEYA